MGVIMLNRRYIEDTLYSIKKIICYYSDTIDYTTYIEELENCIESLAILKGLTTSETEIKQLEEVSQKAKFYLSKAKVCQTSYLSQTPAEER